MVHRNGSISDGLPVGSTQVEKLSLERIASEQLLTYEVGLSDEAKIRYERALVIQQQTMEQNHPILIMVRQRYSNSVSK